MKATRLAVILLTTFGAVSTAQAAPCHDVRGEWTINLQCVGLGPAPFFNTRTLYATVSAQNGCVFGGDIAFTLGGEGFPWVGALHGDQNRSVLSDYAGAKATGELSDRRKGLFREMTFTYTFSGDGNPTACTGTATRDD